MQLILLHTNGTHGHLTPIPTASGHSLGGYARRATFVNEQRAGHDNVLLLDAGDFYQSSRYWHAFKGEPDIELMNLLGYDVAALGNHDFDGGLDLLAARLRQANFPILCANMVAQSGHELEGLWLPYTIKKIGGHRVGIFSLLVDDLPLYPPEFPTSIQCSPIIETAQKIVHHLRDQTDILIFLSHLGHDLDEMIGKTVGGIDLIIGGHTHTPLTEVYWCNKTPLVRSSVGSQHIGRSVLEIHADTRPTLIDYELVPLAESIAEEPAAVQRIQTWTDKLPQEQTLGQLLTPIDTTQAVKAGGESAAGNLYVDALHAHDEATVDLALLHMGSLRGDRVYGPGDFSNLDLIEYHPFPNRPVIRELSGKMLKLLFEWGVSALPEPKARYVSFAGMTVHVDLTRQPLQTDWGSEQILAEGQRIVGVEYRGELIHLNSTDQSFKVAMDGYMGKGGAGFFFLRESPFLYQYEKTGTDIVAQYVERMGQISPRVEGRLQVIG